MKINSVIPLLTYATTEWKDKQLLNKYIPGIKLNCMEPFHRNIPIVASSPVNFCDLSGSKQVCYTGIYEQGKIVSSNNLSPLIGNCSLMYVRTTLYYSEA